MKKNEQIFRYVALAILLGGSYFIYKRVTANKKNSNVDIIINSGNATNKMFLEALSPDYIKAWSDAVNLGSPTFQYSGKNYNTKGGKAIK